MKIVVNLNKDALSGWEKQQSEWINRIREFNSDMDKLQKTGAKIDGSPFKVIKEKTFERMPSLNKISFMKADVEFIVWFLDKSTNSKFAVSIQVTSDAKPGSTDRTVSGKNATAKNIINKLSSLFQNGKW